MKNGMCPYFLGRVEYAVAHRLQKELVRKRQRGEIPDTLIIVEHPPVLTLGRRADRANILVPAERLHELGIQVFEVERGGDVTYHGPGQVVGYPIMDIREQGCDLGAFLRRLEEVLIRVLAQYGIHAGRLPPMAGVWVGKEKIASIGIAVSRWVSYHGFALNVDPEFSHFSLIHPCGIRSSSITSMAKLLGRESTPPREEVETRVVAAFAEVFSLEMKDGPALTLDCFGRIAGILGTGGKVLKTLLEEKKKEREL